MVLLEFHYWSDVVMWGTILTFIGSVIILSFVIALWKAALPPIPNEEEQGYFSDFKIYEGKQLLFSITGKINLMALTLTNTQQASGVLTFKDKKLEITDVPDGAVSLTSSNPEVFTASYEDATNTVTVVAGKSGVAALSIVATNKAGQNIPFEDIAVEVKSGDAATGGVDFSEPTEQPQ